MSPCISFRRCLIRAVLRVAPCHFTRRIITIIDFRSKMHRLHRFEERFFAVRATLDDIIARQQIMIITLMTSITTARRIGLNHFRCAMSHVDTSFSAIESFRFCNLDKIQDRERRERITFLLRAIWRSGYTMRDRVPTNVAPGRLIIYNRATDDEKAKEFR